MKPEDVDWYAEGRWDEHAAGVFARELASYPFAVEGMRVLDLAAGPGAFTAALVDAGAADVVWHERDPHFQRIAAPVLSPLGVGIELRDMFDLPYPVGSFDAVFLRGALYWADDEAELLRRVAAVVRRGGWLVVTSPGWRRPLRTPQSPARRVGHLASPLLAVLFRRKLLTTLWTFERLVERRMRAAGFAVVSTGECGRADFFVVGQRR